MFCRAAPRSYFKSGSRWSVGPSSSAIWMSWAHSMSSGARSWRLTAEGVWSGLSVLVMAGWCPFGLEAEAFFGAAAFVAAVVGRGGSGAGGGAAVAVESGGGRGGGGCGVAGVGGQVLGDLVVAHTCLPQRGGEAFAALRAVVSGRFGGRVAFGGDGIEAVEPPVADPVGLLARDRGFAGGLVEVVAELVADRFGHPGGGERDLQAFFDAGFAVVAEVLVPGGERGLGGHHAVDVAAAGAGLDRVDPAGGQDLVELAAVGAGGFGGDLGGAVGVVLGGAALVDPQQLRHPGPAG